VILAGAGFTVPHLRDAGNSANCIVEHGKIAASSIRQAS